MAQPNAVIREALHAAQVARQRGDLDGERQLLARALASYPESPHLHNALGTRALADGAYDRAIASFAAAAQHDPGEPALLINLASAYRAAGDDAGEQRSLEAALNINRLDFVAHLRLAELFQKQAIMAQAAQHWSAVVQLADNWDQPPPPVVGAAAQGRAFLADHNAAYARALESELGDTLASMSDESRRFRRCVEQMLGRGRVYRNECAGIYFPFLPADEFFERRHFPWFTALEARTDAIRREALSLIERRSEAVRPYVRQEQGTPDNKWTALDGSLDWGASFLWEYGIRNDAVCDRCPETAAALAEVPQNIVPGKAPSAFFSILRPGAHIPPHTGVTNTRAIIHLPLVVPDGCTFRVGGETRAWREGEAFAFDDTIEHEAWNPTDRLRIVLIFDVWNPHLTAREQEQLIKLFTIADRGIVSAKA